MDIGTHGDRQSDAYAYTTDHGRLWFPCRNIGTEIIPPFSVVQLVSVEGNDNPDSYVQESLQGQAVWLVSQVDDDGAATANPAKFAFTGPQQIGVNGQAAYGRCTWSFPVRVRTNLYATNLIGNGMLCGPISGSWGISNQGRGFACLGADSAPVSSASEVRKVWIMPSFQPLELRGRFIPSTSPTLNDSIVAANYSIVLQSADSIDGESITGLDDKIEWLKVYSEWPLNNDTYVADAITRNGLKIPVRGLYDFNLSATLWSTDVDNPGSVLEVGVEVWRNLNGAVSVNTPYKAMRYHDVERDYEQAIKVAVPENVSVGGFLPLLKDDIVSVRSFSSIAMNHSRLWFTLRRVSFVCSTLCQRTSRNGRVSFLTMFRRSWLGIPLWCVARPNSIHLRSWMVRSCVGCPPASDGKRSPR